MTDAHDTRHAGHLASATGPHQHHRAWIEMEGTRVGYSRCQLGAPPLRACPEEPDPWVRWAEKVMVKRPKPPEPRVVCDRHDESRWRTYSLRAGTLCLSCRAEKRRYERVARRIGKEAVRAA